jgi:hypothetical protein
LFVRSYRSRDLGESPILQMTESIGSYGFILSGVAVLTMGFVSLDSVRSIGEMIRSYQFVNLGFTPLFHWTVVNYARTQR